MHFAGLFPMTGVDFITSLPKDTLPIVNLPSCSYSLIEISQMRIEDAQDKRAREERRHDKIGKPEASVGVDPEGLT